MSSTEESHEVPPTPTRSRKDKRDNVSRRIQKPEKKQKQPLQIFKIFDDEPELFAKVRKQCFEYCYNQIESATRKIMIDHIPIDVHEETKDFIAQFIGDWRTKKISKKPFLMQHPIAVQHVTNNDTEQTFYEGITEDFQISTQTPIVCELTPEHVKDLNTLMKTLMESKFPLVAREDEAKFYSIKDIVNWYISITMDNIDDVSDEDWESPPIVIILHNVEQMDSNILYKWLYSCAGHIHELPIVHILRISKAKVEDKLTLFS
jgi:hypothetical protein